MRNYDLLVIGSGPAGQRAAIQGAKCGKKVAVVEQREIVGVEIPPRSGFHAHRIDLRVEIGDENGQNISQPDQDFRRALVNEVVRPLREE